MQDLEIRFAEGIRAHRNINSLVILKGTQTQFLMLRERHRLRLFKAKILRGRLGPEGRKGKCCWIKNGVVRSFLICTAGQEHSE
jgi:hypothetical protein